MLNWNRVADTTAALQSLRRCSVPAGWVLRVLVVDNGSSDGSAAILHERFPEITLVALPENRRFAGGCNLGIHEARVAGAEIIVLLNNDTIVDANLIEHLVMAMDAHPTCAAAGPMIYYARDPRRIWYAGGTLHLGLGVTLHRGLGSYNDARFSRVEPTNFITGCCLALRVSTLDEIGMLDEGYYLYCEDSDWCTRARRKGYDLLFVPQAKLWHAVSGSSGIWNAWKVYHRLRSQLRLQATHARGIARISWPMAIACVYVLYVLRLLQRRQWSAARAVPHAVIDTILRRGIAQEPAFLARKDLSRTGHA